MNTTKVRAGVRATQAAAKALVPGDRLHQHFNDHVRGLAGMVYGRRMYEVMRYWDDDRPDWGAIEHDFATTWRGKPKWVASQTLKSVGPDATLVRDVSFSAARFPCSG